MTDSRGSSWSVQDEVEYLRQEWQKCKEMRNTAYKDGFGAGVAWCLSHAIQKTAQTLEKTAGSWKEFPPDLVKSFAAAMIDFAPEFEKTIIAGLKEQDRRQ